MTKEKHFNDIKVDIVDSNKTYAKFIAEPFERGYGTTIGNSLRRILMTSIPGAAITSVKIDGVQHEFSSIKGIVEDVSQIIQNLKNILSSASKSATGKSNRCLIDSPYALRSVSNISIFLTNKLPIFSISLISKILAPLIVVA